MKIISVSVCVPFLLTLTLSGCFSSVKMEPPTTYLLTELPEKVVNSHQHSINVLVAPPETVAVYNTTEMAYSLRPYQIAYFGKNRWAETPSQMLQPLIVQTLQNTHHFHAVVTPPIAGHYDYILRTQLFEFTQDFTHNPAMMRIILRAQFINATSNRVVATKLISVEEPLLTNTPYSGVYAANRATVRLLKQLASMSVRKIR